MPKRKTHNQFMQEISIKHPKIEVLEQYINSQTKIKCRCKVDGYEWNITPNNLSSGQGCPKCSREKTSYKLKKTNYEFIKEMSVKHPDIIVLGEYKGAKEKIQCKCKIHGYKWSITATNLLSGQGCPKCGKEKIAFKLSKTHNDFIKEMAIKHPKIEVLTEYKNSNTHVKCKCKIDGHIWEAKPSNLLTGYGCPICGKKRASEKERLTQDEFLRQVENSNKHYKNKEIEIVSAYLGLNKKIKCKCKIHDYVWETTGQTLINGSGCPKCTKVYRLSHEEFVKRIGEINPNIIILSKYEKAKDKIKCKCKIDGHEWISTGNTLSNGLGCPICGVKKSSKTRTKTHRDFLVELNKKNDSIEVLSTYTMAKEKVLCRCTKCNTVWEVTPHKLLLNRGSTGCPRCNSSNGERLIRNLLKNNNIQFTEQFSLKNCKNKQPLKFDFALFNAKNLICLIEYQGEQHYKPVEIFGGEEEYKKQVKRDNIKRNYCKSNNIQLIEIPYWEENIEEYLKNAFCEITKEI